MIDKGYIIKTLEGSELEFNSTHKRLSIHIISRIYKKMSFGIKFDAIKVDGNLIIDGHHRYVSSILADYKLEKGKYSKTLATKEYAWSSVEFVDEEWDTIDKINRLNEIDAEFNDIPLKEIIDMLNKI